MRKTVLRTTVLGAALFLAVATGAGALVLRLPPLVVKGDGGFTPTTLPKHRFAPIQLEFHGGISTEDGSIPPIIQQITLWFDKHGEVQTRGLPVCRRGKLLATDTKAARRNCPGAIVGKGVGKAVVYFPEQRPLRVSSPITLFNGPRKHGNPTVLAHAYLANPGPTTYLVSVEIEKVHAGRYGYKTVTEIPKIAGGYGVPIYGQLKIGRKWTYKGHRYSYISASCPDGRLQAKGQFRFDDGTFLQGSVLKRCKGK